jgi:hypothetical protein
MGIENRLVCAITGEPLDARMPLQMPTFLKILKSEVFISFFERQVLQRTVTMGSEEGSEP